MQVIQEAIIEKAKKFVVNNKGKLAALAGLAALGGAAAYGYNRGAFAGIADKVSDIAGNIADDQLKRQSENIKQPANVEQPAPETGNEKKIPDYLDPKKNPQLNLDKNVYF